MAVKKALVDCYVALKDSKGKFMYCTAGKSYDISQFVESAHKHFGVEVKKESPEQAKKGKGKAGNDGPAADDLLE